MKKIYTKTGDKGETSLFRGKRVSKTDLRIEVLGEIDELNSAIGIAIAEIESGKLKIENCKRTLVNIQKDLFKIGSVLGSPTLNSQLSILNLLKKRIKEMEDEIDKMNEILPRLSAFILPGGGRAGSILHFARSICRRVERKIVDLSAKESVNQNILVYFNRLSDLIFVFARFINYKEKEKEIIIG